MRKNILWKLLALCVICVALVTCAFAAESTTSEDGLWVYQAYTDGVELVEYKGTATDVYAPAKVDGKTVVKLGDNLFADNDSLNSVTLGVCITEIGEKTFYDCDQLVCIVINDELTTIGAQAFDSCDIFNSIILKDNVTTIAATAFDNCPEVTIWCNEGNAAYTYAVTNGIVYKLLSTTAVPEIVTVDGIEYYIMNGEAIAVGVTDKAITSVTVPAQVNGYPVTELRETFKSCQKLVSVKLPGCLKTVGIKAFYNCTGLTDITIPDNVTHIGDDSFCLCSKLTSAKLSANLLSIGTNAFRKCTSLANVILPEGLMVIGESAFHSCYAFTEVVIPDSVTQIDNAAFRACTKLVDVIIGNGVTTIGDYAFYLDGVLSSVSFGHSVTTIGDYAFCSSNLQKVEFPDALRSVGKEAFAASYKLTVACLPNGISSLCIDSFPANTVLCVGENSYAHTFAIENDLLYFLNSDLKVPDIITDGGIIYYVLDGDAFAIGVTDKKITTASVPSSVNGYPVKGLRTTFKGCRNLTSVVLPDSVTEIGDRTFYGCDSLTSITFPKELQHIGTYAFYSCNALATLVLPETIVEIGDYAFSYCAELLEVVAGNNVERIGSYAFSFCYNLRSLTIGDENAQTGVTTIDKFAFYSCETLCDVYLSECVKAINTQAFDNCDALSSINLPASVTNIGENAFAFCTNLRAINVSTNSNSFASRDGILYTKDMKTLLMYPYGKFSGQLSVPYGVCSIANYAFEYCDGLYGVFLPETLRYIGDYAFFGCDNLPGINIPANVENIGANAFSSCYDFMQYIVADDNATYASYNGALFSKDMKKLLAYPQNRGGAFIVPEGVTSIAKEAFYNCLNFTEITLPSSITHIGTDAFRNCGLNTVYYNGLVADWCAITFENDFSNPMRPATKSYINGKILTKISLTDGATTISNYALRYWDNLTYVVIPDSVVNISVESIPVSTILCVNENSYAHTFAALNNLLYFVMRETANPEISYGTGFGGTVTYTDGTAAVGVTVEAIYDDGTVKETVTTDENGAYEFTYAEVGRYTVKAIDTDGNTASTTVSVKRMNAFDVYVSGDTALTLKKGYAVSGTVSESATVTITDTDGNVLQTAESTGAFSFADVPNGAYIVKAESANGSVTQEITVFDGDVTDIVLTLPVVEETATIWGYVEVEDRDKGRHRRNWVQITLYNEDGVAVDQQKTDKDGKYEFTKLPCGEYTIVAETAEMRPDKHHGYDRSHKLTGYAYVDASTAGSYEVETIVLREEHKHLTTISGKVTANGQTQDCEVVLRDVFGNELVKFVTANDGQFSFANVTDGQYLITARTKSDGFGYTSVVVSNGTVSGELHFKVLKSSKVTEMEYKFLLDVPDCDTKAEAEQYRDRIAREKGAYDALSKKEKKEASEAYVERLEKLCALLAEVDCVTDGSAQVQQGGMVVSGDELEKGDSIQFELKVEKKDGHTPSEDGVHNEDDFKHHGMKDAAGNREIKQYYEITMFKTKGDSTKQITSVCKDTDTNGKFRITMPVPEEYRGYKHYSLLHEHHGEIVMLTDLDDNPDTITFEVDKFSTFALTATNTELTEETADVALADATLDVSNSLEMTFTVAKTDVTGEGNYAVITHVYSDRRENSVDTIQQSEWTAGETYYTFEYDTYAAKEMTDSITVAVYDANDTLVAQWTEYVCDIVTEAMAAETDTNRLALMEATLEYGAAAQTYFDYSTENLANKGLTAADSYLNSIRSQLTESRNDDCTITGSNTSIIYGASCILGNTLQMKVYFTANDKDVYINGTKTALQASVTEGYYYCTVDVAAEDIFETVTVTVNDGVATVATLTDSVASYCARLYKQAGEKNAALADAILTYGLAAKATNEA